jgi:hypothetical protein
MFRTSVVILGLSLSCLGVGCASREEAQSERACRLPVQRVVQSPDLAAALLFDRRPGHYDASDFAYRSDWPSTESFYAPTELLYSNERFINIQGPGVQDNAYQYSDAGRVTVGYR